MSWRVIVGDNAYWNLLARCAATISVNPSVDALFPTANLYDGRPSKVFRFGSASAPQTIQVDGQLLTNGGLDTWTGGGTVATGWTSQVNGAGSSVTETVVAAEVVQGSGAKLTCGSGAGKFAAIRQDKFLRAGEEATLGYSIRGSGATGRIKVRLQNLLTGKFLTSGLTWSSSVSDLDSRTANTHLASTKLFTVESYGACLSDLVPHRVFFINDDDSASTDGFVDEVALYPSIDVLSLHGHTISAGRVVEFRSSQDGFVSGNVLQATLTIANPSFYGLLGSKVAHRYWRIAISTLDFQAVSDPSIAEIGEAIIAQTTTPARQPNFPIEWGELQDDVGNETPAGESDVTKLAKHPRRTVGLHFDYRSHAEWEEVRDIQRRATGRTLQALLIPDSTRPEVVLGKLDRSWRAARTFNTIYTDSDITMAEMPFAPSTL